MSRLGDLIVNSGPFTWDARQSEARPDISGHLGDEELNELRAELIQLRAAVAGIDSQSRSDRG